MIQAIQVVGLYVRDQSEALAFYVDKLGFRVHTDVGNGAYRWLTVQHPDQPGFQLGLFLPGPPVHDEATAQALHALVAKGAMPRGLRATEGARCRVHAGAGGALRQRGRRLPRSFRQWLEDDSGGPPMKRQSHPPESAGALIDQRIAALGGWRGPLLARLRALLLQAVPDAVEEWKWDNPVWSRGGILCTGEAYKAVVKTSPRAPRCPTRPVQRQPGRQGAPGHRLPRGCVAGRDGADSLVPGSGRRQHVGLIRPAPPCPNRRPGRASPEPCGRPRSCGSSH